ncbi:hypothetical protein ABPG74_019151 [Tetrahymena malaccensis]
MLEILLKNEFHWKSSWIAKPKIMIKMKQICTGCLKQQSLKKRIIVSVLQKYIQKMSIGFLTKKNNNIYIQNLAKPNTQKIINIKKVNKQAQLMYFIYKTLNKNAQKYLSL